MLARIAVIVLLVFLTSCIEKEAVTKEKLTNCYEEILLTNIPLEKRIENIRLLKDVINTNIKENIKSVQHRKIAVNYLLSLYSLLENRNNSKDYLILLEIKKTLSVSGVSLTEKNLAKTAQPGSKDWLDTEKKERQKKAEKLTSSANWDKRVYGTWQRKTKKVIEQYEFFSDTAFEYIKIPYIGDENQDNEKLTDFIEVHKKFPQSEIHRGNYEISTEEQTIILTIWETGQSKTTFNYHIDGQKLDLNDNSFFRK